LKNLNDFDLIVSFGYRHIIDKKILLNLKKPIVNLHMSYLPYNRGAHPNYWSLVENTPSGITIHEIDQGIDTGPIIFQKKIKFNTSLKPYNTFKKTYKILKKEIEKLFMFNFNLIEKNKYIVKRQLEINSTFHSKNQLPKIVNNWNINIDQYKMTLKTKSKN